MRFWMKRGAVGRGIVGTAIVVLGNASCTMPDFLTPRSPTPVPMPTAAAVQSDGLTVSVLPSYRVVLSPGLAALPSRLLVLQIRISTIGDAALSVAPDDLVLTLPSGQPGLIFDRARAVEILHRTTLAEADLSQVPANGAVGGGAQTQVPAEMSDVVANNLLSDGVFISGQSLQGFVLVDTGTALMSLDGASLAVTAFRLRDGEPVQLVYPFQAPPLPTETPAA